MTALLPRAARARRGAALLLALLIGVATLAITDDDGDDRALPATTSTSAPRVLGAVVTTAPEASPAQPAEVDVPTTDPAGATDAAGPVRSGTPARRRPTTTAPPSTTTSGATDPTLIPATVIENTTTTTTEASTSTTDGTTSTTEDPTPTTAEPTSTTAG